jgi:hypothetical protein
MTQPCDRRPGVTVAVPRRSCDDQLHVTAAREITRHTCVFPSERIVVVRVIGAQSQDEAREACLAAWQPCRYEVQDGDPTNGQAVPFVLRAFRKGSQAGRALPLSLHGCQEAKNDATV